MEIDKNKIKDNNEGAFVFNKTLQVFDALKGPASEEEIFNKRDKIFSKIQSRIEPPQKTTRLRDLYLVLTSIAATLLLIFSVGVLTNGMGALVSQDLGDDEAIQWMEVYSPTGMISRLTLPDGSKVVLNNNSKLTYPIKFSDNERMIKLDGEAFFEIEKDTLKPFLIHTSGMNVRVLGTSFNLKAYDDDSETILSLKQGLVQAETIRKGAVENIKLEPGEQLIVDRFSETLERKKVNVNWYTTWINGKLVYRDETLGRILKDSEQRFDIDIVVKDSMLLKDRYFVSFMHGETVKQMLYLLSYKRDWNYQLKETDQIVIKKKS